MLAAAQIHLPTTAVAWESGKEKVTHRLDSHLLASAKHLVWSGDSLVFAIGAKNLVAKLGQGASVRTRFGRPG
jgi:hypothetical protein